MRGYTFTAVMFCLLAFRGFSEGQWLVQRDNPNEMPVSVDFIDSVYGWVALSNANYILYTEDGGINWSTRPSPGNLKKIQFLDLSTGYAVNDAGFFKTTDGGYTWELIHSYYWPENLFFVTKDIGFVIYQWYVFKTTDGGKTFVQVHIYNDSSSIQYIKSLTFVNESFGYCLVDSLYYTSDGGTHWRGRERPDINVLGLCFLNAGIGWMSSSDGTVWKTIDSAGTWQKIFEGNQYTSLGNVRFLNDSVGFVNSGNRSLGKSVDGGKSWDEIPVAGNGTTTSYDYDFNDDRNVWVVGTNGTILKLKDGILVQPAGGETLFSQREYDIKWKIYHPIEEKAKLEISTDSGNTWFLIADSIDLSAGKFNWNVDSAFAGRRCRIKLGVPSGTFSVQSDSDFSIYKNGHIRLLSPKGGETFWGGDVISIRWDADYTSASWVLLQFFRTNDTTRAGGTLFWQPSAHLNDTAYSTQLPNDVTSFCKLKIVDENESWIFSESGYFKIRQHPGLALAAPDQWIWMVDSTRRLALTTTNIGQVRVDFSSDSGAHWIEQFRRTITDSIGTSVVTMDWKIPGIESKECLLKITSVADSSISTVSAAFETTRILLFGKLPLHIGNKWFYQHYISLSSDSINNIIRWIWEAVDTVKYTDGRTYYKIRILQRDLRQENLFTVYDSAYIGQFGNIVKVISSGPLSLGEFSVSFLNMMDINQDNVLQKTLRSISIGSMLDQSSIADSLGFTTYHAAWWWPTYYDRLAGCILDSRPYGTVVVDYTVGIQKEPQISPGAYSLSQNYPNPFNPATTITFSLPRTAHVTLKIYNSIGEEVQILTNEIKKQGVYRVAWNGSNLSSGVYFYRIQAGTFMKTNKMILLK